MLEFIIQTKELHSIIVQNMKKDGADYITAHDLIIIQTVNSRVLRYQQKLTANPVSVSPNKGWKNVNALLQYPTISEHMKNSEESAEVK